MRNSGGGIFQSFGIPRNLRIFLLWNSAVILLFGRFLMVGLSIDVTSDELNSNIEISPPPINKKGVILFILTILSMGVTITFGLLSMKNTSNDVGTISFLNVTRVSTDTPTTNLTFSTTEGMDPVGCIVGTTIQWWPTSQTRLSTANWIDFNLTPGQYWIGTSSVACNITQLLKVSLAMQRTDDGRRIMTWNLFRGCPITEYQLFQVDTQTVSLNFTTTLDSQDGLYLCAQLFFL
jgi:hypothetical protein